MGIFTKIGIAEASLLGTERGYLKQWLCRGYNGQMAFLTRNPERRCDPRAALPECKSVIVAAMKFNEMPHKNNPPHLPKYLQYEDYHKVMMERLEAVADTIKREHPEAQCKCYVDTGPVLEKAWGVKAGLGFIGKNTLLISPEHGSQMALGVVLTNAPSLQPSPSPARRLFGGRGEGEGGNDNVTRCGTCTACISACPTGALVAPYILDARKCISYKYFIEKVEGGCDVCQDVCPYNR